MKQKNLFCQKVIFCDPEHFFFYLGHFKATPEELCRKNMDFSRIWRKIPPKNSFFQLRPSKIVIFGRTDAHATTESWAKQFFVRPPRKSRKMGRKSKIRKCEAFGLPLNLRFRKTDSSDPNPLLGEFFRGFRGRVF